MTAGERRHRRQIFLISSQGLTALAAVLAMVISLISFGSRLDSIQSSRQRAATDSCRLLRSVVLAAFPPDDRRLALELIHAERLDNCLAYGFHVRHTGG